MDDNPYSDGKIRSRIVRAIAVGTALVIAVNVPYAWYWRVLIFLGLSFLVGLIYPNVQHALAKRRDRQNSN
jgi:hypothetical protein